MFNARQVYVLYSEGSSSIIFFSRVFGQCARPTVRYLKCSIIRNVNSGRVKIQKLLQKTLSILIIILS